MVKLQFGNLEQKAAAEADLKRAHDWEVKVQRCLRTMANFEKVPERNLVKIYGRDVVDECHRRFAEKRK